MRLKRRMLALAALLLPGCGREPTLHQVLDGRVGVPAAEREALAMLYDGTRTADVVLVRGDGLLGGFGARTVQVREGRVVGLATLGGVPSEPLNAFTELRRLVLHRSELESLDGLGPWPRLEELRLEFTPLASLEGVASCCPKLRALTVSHGPLHDLGPLADLSELERLDLAHSELTSLASAPALPSLKTLHLTSSPLESLKGIGGFSGLEELQLFGIKTLRQLGDLPSLPELRELTLFQNGLVALSGLPDLPALERIETSDNKILSAQLDGLPMLRELEMHEKELLSVELGPLESLEKMDLVGEGSLFKDGGRLERLAIATQPALERLDVRHNHLRDLSDLEPQPTLWQIELDRNPFDDLRRFESGFPSLRHVSVHRTKVKALPAELAQAGLVVDYDESEVEANMWEGVLRDAFEKMRDSFVEELPAGGGSARHRSASCTFKTAIFSTPRLNCTGSVDKLSGIVYLPLVEVDPLSPGDGQHYFPVRATIRTRQGRARIYLKYELNIRGQAEALAAYTDRERPLFELGDGSKPEDVKKGYSFAEARPGSPASTFGEAQVLVDQLVVWVEGLDGAEGIEYVLESPYR